LVWTVLFKIGATTVRNIVVATHRHSASGFKLALPVADPNKIQSLGKYA
jgi:hypothetical protein